MLQLNFDPFPMLETERLLLRNLVPEDNHQVFAIRSNAATMQYIPRPIAKTVDDALAVIDMITGFTARNERINWAITAKRDASLIGIIGYVNVKEESYRAEVGYVMHPGYLRHGYAYEAMNAVLEYGFHVMNLHSVEAIIRPENTASINLAEKAGFTREGYFKDYIFHNGRFWDATVYSLILDKT